MKDASGRLVFQYRDGGSGNGSQIYNVYSDKSQSWARLLEKPLFDGEGKRNAYLRGPTHGPDGWFHVLWVWRDTPDCATNHHLSYARSRDLIHWESVAGQSLELPITLGSQGVVVDPAPPGGGMINGGQRLVFDSEDRPLIVYHKNDPEGNMQLYAARSKEGRWITSALTDWDAKVAFSGRGSMPFIGIGIGGIDPLGEGLWSLSWRHRNYGTGRVVFREDTLEAVTGKLPMAVPDLPSSLLRSESSFPGLDRRIAQDLGSSGDPDIRYVMAWEALGSNHDRKPSGDLPPPSQLRVYKLVR
jgi:hypothetical protein